MKLINNQKEIAEISRLNLKPDDIIVLDYKDTQPTQDVLHNSSAYLNQLFPNNRILFLCGGVELKVFNDGGMESEQRD